MMKYKEKVSMMLYLFMIHRIYLNTAHANRYARTYLERLNVIRDGHTLRYRDFSASINRQGKARMFAKFDETVSVTRGTFLMLFKCT